MSKRDRIEYWSRQAKEALANNLHEHAAECLEKVAEIKKERE